MPGRGDPGRAGADDLLPRADGVFGNLTQLPGFDADSYSELHHPGQHAAGRGLHRRRDRASTSPATSSRAGSTACSASPAPRWVLLAGIVLSASVRALIPATVLLCVGFVARRSLPGRPAGSLIAFVLVMGMAAVAACWGSMLALRLPHASRRRR